MSVLKIIGVILIIVIGIFLIVERIDSGKSEVHQWAQERGLEVKSINTHMTQFGTPFYYLNKGSYIYEVEMTNGEKWWVRTGLFSNDYERDKSN